MTILEKKRDSQQSGNDENIPVKDAQETLEKCRLAAGLLMTDADIPWMYSEKV